MNDSPFFSFWFFQLMGWGLGRGGGGAFAKFPVNEMVSKFSGKGKTSEGAGGRFEEGREGGGSRDVFLQFIPEFTLFTTRDPDTNVLNVLPSDL